MFQHSGRLSELATIFENQAAILRRGRVVGVRLEHLTVGPFLCRLIQEHRCVIGRLRAQQRGAIAGGYSPSSCVVY